MMRFNGFVFEHIFCATLFADDVNGVVPLDKKGRPRRCDECGDRHALMACSHVGCARVAHPLCAVYIINNNALEVEIAPISPKRAYRYTCEEHRPKKAEKPVATSSASVKREIDDDDDVLIITKYVPAAAASSSSSSSSSKRKAADALVVAHHTSKKAPSSSPSVEKTEAKDVQQQQQQQQTYPATWDEGACRVCGEDWEEFHEDANGQTILDADGHTLHDQMVICETCECAYHQSCYGIDTVPEGDWFCRPCAAGCARGSVQCAICLGKEWSGFSEVVMGDEDKSKRNKVFAHVACALWHEQTYFQEPLERNRVAGVGDIPARERVHTLVCKLCERKDGGAKLLCQYPGCGVAFHTQCMLRHPETVFFDGHNRDTEGPAGSLELEHYCRAHLAPKTKTTTKVHPQQHRYTNNTPEQTLRLAARASLAATVGDPIAQELERKLFQTHHDCQQTYRRRVREIAQNLRWNVALAGNAADGRLTLDALVAMSNQDMASHVLRSEREQIHRASLASHTIASQTLMRGRDGHLVQMKM